FALTTPAQPGGTPAIDAIEPAIADVRRHLFPFRFDRWVTLGLVCFLDQCSRRGGSSLRLPFPGGSGGGGGGEDVSSFLTWLAAHVAVAAVIAAVVLAALVALFALVLWIHSRAVFVYIDDVATGRADLARPWRENAALAG